MPNIIGITGRKFHGKGEVGKVLCQSYNFKELNMADPLKRMLEALGVPWENLWGDKKEEPLELLGGKSGRYAAQTLGTEWGRELIDQHIWTNAWKLNAQKILESGYNVVATDIRFLNEEQLIHNLGGTLIRVVRPDLPENKFSNHPSEQFIDTLQSDYEISNNGDLSLLRQKVEEFCRSVNLEKLKVNAY